MYASLIFLIILYPSKSDSIDAAHSSASLCLNVLQDGDIIESHYIVERRNRTIYKRMREYLYELTHSDELVTAVMPIGDGITVSTKL